jgi:hypothetical protein
MNATEMADGLFGDVPSIDKVRAAIRLGATCPVDHAAMRMAREAVTCSVCEQSA